MTASSARSDTRRPGVQLNPKLTEALVCRTPSCQQRQRGGASRLAAEKHSQIVAHLFLLIVLLCCSTFQQREQEQPWCGGSPTRAALAGAPVRRELAQSGWSRDSAATMRLLQRLGLIAVAALCIGVAAVVSRRNAAIVAGECRKNNLAKACQGWPSYRRMQ